MHWTLDTAFPLHSAHWFRVVYADHPHRPDSGLKESEAYLAVQAGLLTPLTFTQHHLSPLAAFTSGAFFTTEGGDSEIVNFTLPTLMTLLEASSQNVSGNKQ